MKTKKFLFLFSNFSFLFTQLFSFFNQTGHSCQPGKTTDHYHAYKCDNCALGSAQPNQGGATEHCPLCSVGFYAPIIGMTDCESCGISSYALIAGATQCNTCLTLDAWFGLSAPDQCMITWILMMTFCMIIMCCCGFIAWCKGGCRCIWSGPKKERQHSLKLSGSSREFFNLSNASIGGSPSPNRRNGNRDELLGSPQSEMINRESFTHQMNPLEENSTPRDIEGNAVQNVSTVLVDGSKTKELELC